MVLSVSSFFLLFCDFGLSLVTVQRPDITQEQLSTLFWVNIAFGIFLGVLLACLAPVIVWFFDEPRLLRITIIMSVTFPLIALGIQHQALLKREMKFPRLAFVRLIGTSGGGIISIAAALSGWGYWALVCQPIMSTLIQTVASYFTYRWKPGWPRRCEGLRSMLKFGGSLTGHGIVGYFSNNLDKVLLGRFAGMYALGLYSTSYNVIIKVIGLAGYSVGEAAIPAMSRCHDSPDQQRAIFRRLFSLTALCGFPVCIAGVFWGDDLVLTLLGNQWIDAIPIMQILFIASIARLITVCTGWVYVSTGRPGRMFQWQIIWSIFITIALVAGLSYGVTGVAIAYAIANWMILIPAFMYCFHGTAYSASDVLRPLTAPMICALLACLTSVVVQNFLWPDISAGPIRLGIRLIIAAIIFSVTTIKSIPLATEAFSTLLKNKQQSRRGTLDRK